MPLILGYKRMEEDSNETICLTHSVDSMHHPLSPEHGPDRGPRGGGGVRGGGAGARAARRLPPVGGHLGAEAEGPRVLQENHRTLLRIQTRHVSLQPRQGS